MILFLTICNIIVIHRPLKLSSCFWQLRCPTCKYYSISLQWGCCSSVTLP